MGEERVVNDGVYAELAEVISTSAPLIMEATREHARITWRGSRLNDLNDEEYAAWLQYELDLFARVATHGGDCADHQLCPGIALFSVPGCETISIALAIDGQLFAAKCLAPIIQRRFFGNPDRYMRAMACFERTIESSIAVNVSFFESRVAAEIQSLDSGSLPAIQPVVGDSVPVVPVVTHDAPSLSAPAPEVSLSAREIEVIKLVAKGRSNGEIAAELHITQNTVKNHIRRSLERLGYNSRVQLGVYAVCRELIAPDELAGLS